MSKPTIKHRSTGAVLFEGEAGMTTREMLEKATTSRADLSGANLYGADLSGANLYGADLYGADLSGANLYGKKLIGKRPFFSIGPIGSRSDYFQAWLTNAGVMIKAGCFFNTRAQFEIALDAEHGDNEHGQEYRAALVLIDAHAKLWMPAQEVSETVTKEVPA